MHVGRVPDLATFHRLQRFLERRLRAQERRGEAPDILNDPAAREALAQYELFPKRPTLFVPQHYQR